MRPQWNIRAFHNWGVASVPLFSFDAPKDSKFYRRPGGVYRESFDIVDSLPFGTPLSIQPAFSSCLWMKTRLPDKKNEKEKVLRWIWMHKQGAIT